MAPQRYIVAPDPELMAFAADLRRKARQRKGQSRVDLFGAAVRIEQIAQAHAELAAAFAAQVADCARLRAERVSA